MPTPISQIASELAGREAIRKCVCRYSRGIDRLDTDMLRRAFWENCVDNHMGFCGNAEEFIASSFPIMDAMDQSQHFIANILIAIRGDTADAESHFYGFDCITTPEGEKNDVTGDGRYLGTLDKRGEEWLIMKRMMVTDWFRHNPGSADWSKGMLGIMIERDGRYPDDDTYKLLNLK